MYKGDRKLYIKSKIDKLNNNDIIRIYYKYIDGYSFKISTFKIRIYEYISQLYDNRQDKKSYRKYRNIMENISYSLRR